MWHLQDAPVVRLRTWAPVAVLVAGYVGFLVYAYPGFMSSDSLLQVTEARAGTYSNWHPPAMAALWRLAEHVVSGPAGMLVLQSTAFLVGTYRLLRRCLSPLAAAGVAVGILLWPPVLVTMAVVWKDSQMAGYLLLGASLVIEEDVRWQIAGVLVLMLASMMRDNAPAAVLPLLVFGYRSSQPWKKRVLAAVAIWVAITVAAIAWNKHLTTNEEHQWYSAIAANDIVGILHYAPRSDADVEQLLAGAPLVVHENIASHTPYEPRMWRFVLEGPKRLFDYPKNDAERAAILRAWKGLVLGSPGTYLHVRLRVFQEVLGLSRRPLFDAVWHERQENWTAPTTVPLRASQEAIGDAMDWLAYHGGIFRPYLYFLVACVLLALARRDLPMLALVASGICYELTLVPFAPSADARYSHWMITTALLVAVSVVAKRRASRRPA